MLPHWPVKLLAPPPNSHHWLLRSYGGDAQTNTAMIRWYCIFIEIYNLKTVHLNNTAQRKELEGENKE